MHKGSRRTPPGNHGVDFCIELTSTPQDGLSIPPDEALALQWRTAAGGPTILATSIVKDLSIVFHVGMVGAGSAVGCYGRRDEIALLHIKNMDFTVLNHIVPAVQGQLPDSTLRRTIG